MKCRKSTTDIIQADSALKARPSALESDDALKNDAELVDFCIEVFC